MDEKSVVLDSFLLFLLPHTNGIIKTQKKGKEFMTGYLLAGVTGTHLGPV